MPRLLIPSGICSDAIARPVPVNDLSERIGWGKSMLRQIKFVDSLDVNACNISFLNRAFKYYSNL